MGLNIHKTDEEILQATLSEEAVEATTHTAADEYYDLTQRLEDLSEDPVVREFIETEELRSSLVKRLRVENSDHADEVLILGSQMNLLLGVPSLQSYVDDEAKKSVIDMVSPGQFWSLVNFKIGDLKKYLTKAQQAKVISVERTGFRKVELKPKAK